MSDPRVEKLADLLANYSFALQPSGRLNEPDPVAAWRQKGRHMTSLAGRDHPVARE